MNELIRQYGSFRRLLEAYWSGALTPENERTIEDSMPKERIALFKPFTIAPELNRCAGCDTLPNHPHGRDCLLGPLSKEVARMREIGRRGGFIAETIEQIQGQSGNLKKTVSHCSCNLCKGQDPAGVSDALVSAGIMDAQPAEDLEEWHK